MQRMTLLVATILIGLGLFDAHAQSTGGLSSPAPSSPQAPAKTGQGAAQAPVGHRQPRATDVPNQGQMGSSPADAEIDQKLTICRDCR
jgi:hypothetical protein